jgi:hypothetical protein
MPTASIKSIHPLCHWHRPPDVTARAALVLRTGSWREAPLIMPGANRALEKENRRAPGSTYRMTGRDAITTLRAHLAT